MTAPAFSPEVVAGARIDELGFPIQRMPSRKTVPFEERFWSKVRKGSNNECWQWLGPVSGGGVMQHGCIYKNGRTLSAHRASYAMAYGPIPKGMIVRHKCDNPICMNPNHLEIGTSKDNNLDCSIRDRKPRHLSNAQVYQVRKLHLFGLSDKEIADVFGVCADTIFKARAVNYKYLPWPTVHSKFERIQFFPKSKTITSGSAKHD